MEEIFIQLAIILFTAFIVSYIVRMFNQPIIIGYIIAGMIISPFILESGASKEIIEIFSQLGIAFLLFMVGLHMNPKIIREIGTSSILIGAAQIALTFVLGFVVALKLMSFDVVTSVYIGIALTFSSTIIITKLLSDKRQLDSLYGKISIGILIFQDLVAVAVLMFISSISDGGSFGALAVKTFIGGGILVAGLFLIGYLVLPRVTRSIARSQELLFLFSICWAFVIAALFAYFGFSIEIGALIAGVVLSISPYSTEISSKIRPLRDFFLIIFFIILGLNIPVQDISSLILNALILSAVVLVFKPLVLMTFMAMFGYTKRTNFLVGTTMAQISEFSLIVLILAASIGHISEDIVHMLALTLVITIVVSSYMITYSKKLYSRTAGFISLFERKHVKREKKPMKEYDTILFGYNRIGFSILQSLRRIKRNYLVVDFNPDTINILSKARIPCLYGDVYDYEFLGELPLENAKMIVSTIPDFETNFLLIETVRLVNPDAIIVVRAHQIKEALDLYRKGANYVLTPHFLGGDYVAKMIKELKVQEKGYEFEKRKHIKMLEERLKKGYDHPEVERN